MRSNVFDIERYATEDGHGIRTDLFLKGCPLRCIWCANPESQERCPENMLNANTCINCGRCKDVCPNHAIWRSRLYGYLADKNLCEACGDCVESCFMDARKIMGRYWEKEDLLREVLRDRQYFGMSGGGVTFSGGEPFCFPEVVLWMAKEIRKQGYTTLAETCGCVPLENIRKCADALDFIYYDFKHIDARRHKELTGKDNRLIINNLLWLAHNFQGVLSVRYPYIPGCNSKEGEIKGFFQFIREKKITSELIFLPYHHLGLPKYHGLGRKYEMDGMKSIKKEEMNHLFKWARECKLEIKIQ